MAITKNIVTDYSCPTNGTSDCTPAFLAFKADAQGQTATLNVPAGTYMFRTNGGYVFDGIPDLTVNMTGATLTDSAVSPGVGGFVFGCLGSTDLSVYPYMPKINTVAAGATSVFCKTPSQAGIFTVGKYVLITGLDVQGYGQPINPFWFEYAVVASVNTSTGQVGLTAPLRHSYKDTWPQYTSGSVSEPDPGGPATIYKMMANWDCSHVYNGGTIDFHVPGSGINCNGRLITFSGGQTIYSTLNISGVQWLRFINFASNTYNIEVDKIVERFTVEGSSFIEQFFVQSGGTELIELKDTSHVHVMNGTSKKLVCDPGVTIDTLKMGPSAYGRADEVVFNGCTIGTLDFPGGARINITDASPAWTMSGGVITVPGGVCVTNMTPEGTCYWEGQYYGPNFRILDITQPGGVGAPTYVYTTHPGGFPPVSLASGKLYMRAVGALRSTFTNVISTDPNILDLNRAAPGRPPHAYSRRTYTKASGTAPPSHPIYGKIISISINVTLAFAGTGALSFALSPFGNLKLYGGPPSYTLYDYAGIINLRQAGNRIITPSGVTSGPFSGDSALALPGTETEWWLINGASPTISNNVSADPSDFSVTVEIYTDQGVVDLNSLLLFLPMR